MRFGQRQQVSSKRVASPLFVETVDISVQSHLGGQLGYLRRCGFRPYVIARDTGSLRRVLDENNVSGHSRRLERDPAPFADVVALFALIRDIRRLRPGLIVYGTPKASLLASVASFLTRVPRRTYFVFGIRAETASGIMRRILLLAERLVLAASTDVLAVGESLKARMATLGLPTAKVRILGSGSANGIDVRHYADIAEGVDARARARREFDLPLEAEVVGFVGRITPDKGIDALVASIEKLRSAGRDTCLLLVGPTENVRDLLVSTREAMTAPWVRVIGSIPDTALAYPAMDVFCLPSRREGLPTVVLEAAAAGIPIVATEATGVRDVLDERTGTIVPIDDPVALAHAITMLLDDPDRARRLALQAKRTVSERFDHEVVWRNLAEHYSS